MRRGPQVAVIGAGIVGASVAYHLARRGAAVTLIDKGQPAGECTGKSFAWIGPGDPLLPLQGQTHTEYHRLERELHPALRVEWPGSLVWKDDPAATEHYARERAAAGYDIRLVERDEMARLEPNLRERPDLAALSASHGAIDPLETTLLLVRAAQEFGARVQLGVRAAKLVVAGSRVTGVSVGDQVFEADIVVVAAGVDTNLLTEPVGISLPIESSPAMLVRLRTPGRLVKGIVASPARELRQMSDDMMISPEEGIGDGEEAAAERVLGDAKRMLSGAEGVQIDGMGIGWRPMPADGRPIVGFAPVIEGLYFTVMHGGVDLAPTIGRLASVEILDGVSVRLLDACRPDRFLRRPHAAR